MTTRKVVIAGEWEEVDAGISVSSAEQYPQLASENVSLATSVRTAFTIAGDATPFADSAWTEIDASLSEEMHGISVVVTNNTFSSGTDTSTVLEFATGSAGNEVLWGVLGVGWRTGVNDYTMPGLLPAGSRVTARVRSAVISKSVTFIPQFLRAGQTTPGAPVTMGYTPAAAAGVVLPTPAGAHTKGAWVEVEDSTPSDLTQLMVCIQGGRTNAQTGNYNCLIDIGIGAAAAETVLVPNIYVITDNAERIDLRTMMLTFGIEIPAGSRLSARYQAANVAAMLDVFLVGA